MKFNSLLLVFGFIPAMVMAQAIKPPNLPTLPAQKTIAVDPPPTNGSIAANTPKPAPSLPQVGGSIWNNSTGFGSQYLDRSANKTK